MQSYSTYLQWIEEAIAHHDQGKTPRSLYEPHEYFMSLGGKRLRPVLCLMCCDAMGGDALHAIPQALALEYFHNFSLVHDDIMDQSNQRRGKTTVHLRNGMPTAILLGDLMLVQAYELLCANPGKDLPDILNVFTRIAREVCEGQQKDMDFEQVPVADLEVYLDMIRQKTAVLLGCSMEMGAIMANANLNQRKAAFMFGEYSGMAFQLMDDYLDAFGDSSKTGKKKGGDIYARKKTCLYIYSMIHLNESERNDLSEIYMRKENLDEITVEKVCEYFVKAGADEYVKQLAEKYAGQAIHALNETGMPLESRRVFEGLSQSLLIRQQ